MSSRWAHALKILVSPRLVSSRIWTHAASDAKRDQVPHRHYDHPHKGAPRRKCLHHLHTLTLWSPYKTFQSTCKRELSNHFMIYINAEKLTSQPRRMIASKMLLPRSAEKGSFWSQDQRLWRSWWHWPGARGDFDCTENSRPSVLLDMSAGHNLTPHKFDHFRSLPCYLYCTSLFCLLLKKMTAIYLLGNMYLDITWSTPWGSEMTNDQGRLMILYIIYYIIKVNRASSMLNLGPSKIADWKHFPLWSTDDA